MPTAPRAWAWRARATALHAPRPAELRRLLDDPAYATAPGVAVRVRVEDGVGAACDAIEERLG